MELIEALKTTLEEKELPALAYQYVIWNEARGYQTQSFSWFQANIELLCSLEAIDQESAVHKACQSFTHIGAMANVIRDQEEFQDFCTFMNVIPFA
ncbi:hypothetical protein P4637_19400 [Halalkalibacterium halodurans]|uniref:Uncharacterized protein n=1 Tax=Halalkalibacterium halodurans TaxID=86665 RepID=A0A0M0KHD9_ALKHA|nr:hypothetical protein [Halalkalibacterium halodurans]MDY7223850.1 hypothetical protein [Halalkalibacterium halodurans]MDY7243071.1 hypothetical protein [Halalkalibacterium halodurans]MED3648788.1 hypothetical protein [Halalkalibacterium halodurans]MED4083112.1 hypothetical protein [Halalkalibacterium halodurans]MED4086986.1 hypothetical protein [Halalkalibacterium halodurans]